MEGKKYSEGTMESIFTKERLEAAAKVNKRWGAPFFVGLALGKGTGVERFRAQLESWTGNLPANERKEFISRFTNYDNRVHLSAFFELVWHQFFFEEGWRIEKHPELPSGKKPDFLVHAPKQKFYFEVITVFQDRQAELDEKAFAQLLDELHKVEHRFFVSIEPATWLPSRFRPSLVRKFIEKELDKLALKPPSTSPPWEITYSYKGYDLKFLVYQRSHSKRGTIVGAIVYPISTGFLGSLQIRQGIKRKVKKYKDMKKLKTPLVVAVCSGDTMHIDSDTLEYELFGYPVVTWQVGTSETSTRLSRDRNGLFVPKRGDHSDPLNTRVSGVMFCKRKWLEDERMAYVMELSHNPWAENALSVSVLPKFIAQLIPEHNDKGVTARWRNRDEKKVVIFP